MPALFLCHTPALPRKPPMALSVVVLASPFIHAPRYMIVMVQTNKLVIEIRHAALAKIP